MTTSVTVEVPESADYKVAIETETAGFITRQIIYVKAGEKRELYLHSDLRVVRIEEIPL